MKCHHLLSWYDPVDIINVIQVKACQLPSGVIPFSSFILLIEYQMLFVSMPISRKSTRNIHVLWWLIIWFRLCLIHFSMTFQFSAESNTIWNDANKRRPSCWTACTTMPTPVVLIFKSCKNVFPTVTSNTPKSLLRKSSFHYVFVITDFCLMNLMQAVILWIIDLGKLQ